MGYMRRKSVRLLIVLSLTGLAACAANAADVIWTAYNDCLKETGDATAANVTAWTGDATAANVTAWTIHNNDSSHSTGRLKDFETGSDSGMPIVTFTMGAPGLRTSNGGAAGNPNPGTPAYDLFHDDSGNMIVDLAPNHVAYGDTGWWAEIRFTGLDAAKTYTFAGTAIRSSDYPDRISLFTIKDADLYVNNSNVPAAHPDWRTEDTTKLQAGDNRSPGYVVRWDGIVPGGDGDFTVRAEAAPESVGGRAYPFGGFMLQQAGEAGNRAPSVGAGADRTAWLRSSSVTTRLDGDVSDDGMGDPNGYLSMEWTRIGGTGEGPILFDPNTNIEDPNFTVYDFGTYVLRLEATDGEKTGSDTVTITVNEGLKGDMFIDNKVDWQDMVLFSGQWLNEAPSLADLVGNDGVDVVDYAVLAGNWWVETFSSLVEISEFMADNRDSKLTIYEPGGEQHSPDWIEIHNLDVNAIDLGGWYLTDDETEPNKWQLPAGFTIGGGGYRIVFASGLGDSTNQFVDPYGYYHTSFQLDKDGDYLGLVGPGTVGVVHEFADYEYDHGKFGFPPQQEDYSYGLLDTVKRYFAIPTPEAGNSDAFIGFVEDTKFSHDRGFYYGDFFLQISTDTPGATIRYTTDASAPSDSHGRVYVPGNPIHITTTTCVRATPTPTSSRTPCSARRPTLPPALRSLQAVIRLHGAA